MKPTYRAMQVTSPGTLERVERPTSEPGAGTSSIWALGQRVGVGVGVGRRPLGVRYRMVPTMRRHVDTTLPQ